MKMKIRRRGEGIEVGGKRKFGDLEYKQWRKVGGKREKKPNGERGLSIVRVF